MNRKFFSILTATMWLALPLIALRYWLVWDKLPARMSTHFAANGQPNGWMSRAASFYFATGVTAFVLVAFTAIAYAMQKQKNLNASSAGLLGFFYLMLGFVYYANNGVVAHNLTGRPVEISPVLIGVPIAVLLFTLIYLGTQRGAAFPRDPALTQEVHGSRVWALLFLMLTVLEFAIFAAIPSTGVRVGMFLMCLLFLLIAAHVWTGFQYRFTPSGVEIRTLGFRLRSIPRGDIRDYRIESWTPWRGYGIRGIGNTRAYVWGNKVVHISTQHGEVFLGHNDPARIVRDLDQMMQFTHS
jgi:hypothetical protein